MDAEKELLMGIPAEEKSKLENASKIIMNTTRFPKSAALSEGVRKEGNALFRRKNHNFATHREIFSYYNKSISAAPLVSELLAQAYYNRSALLLHIHKYEDCIKDIDRTLTFAKSDLMTVKLLCRKVECLKKMGSSNYQSALDAADSYAREVDKNYKAQVDKLIEKAKTCVSNNEVLRDQSDQSDIVLPQLDDTLNCISIEHNEKWGRHLVSRKNYEPGDLIFIENIYVTLLNPTMSFTNCNYCLKICWSGIPCDYCNWAMFCDEDCKKKAWDTFHDVECSVMPDLMDVIPEHKARLDLSLRMLLVGIREAGSIAKLKAELELVDQYSDIPYKGFCKNGQFTSCTICSLYSLKSRAFSQSQLSDQAEATILVLVAIIQNKRLINNFKFEKIDDILANEDLVFLGSLFIKFLAINPENCMGFAQVGSGDIECYERGDCLAPLASLINHSCDPNASVTFSEDKKVIVYALKTIKRNSQIFFTYAGHYYENPFEDRKKKLEHYTITCECQACIESWPCALPPPCDLEHLLYFGCEDTLKALVAEKLTFNRKDFNQKHKKELCETIKQIERLLKPNRPGPINLTRLLENALQLLYMRFYGWIPPVVAFEQCG